MRSNLTPPLYLELANELALTTNVSGDVNDSPSLFILVFNAIDRHIGGVLPLTSLATRSWNAPILTWGFEGPFGINSPHHPPRFGNPMSIMSWLDTFPIEWGPVDYHTTADLRNEVVIQGPPNTRGWYASGGTPDYREVMMSTSPYSLKPYGALAMTIISQALTGFLPQGQPVFSYQTFAWDRTGLTPALIVPANPNPPIWDGMRRCFEPCTVQSFDWLSNTAYAPVLQEVVVGPQTLEALGTSMLDNAILFFGFAMALKVTHPAPPTTVVPLPGLKRRMGINFGPSISSDEPTPPPAKVALSDPPVPLQPSTGTNPSPN